MPVIIIVLFIIFGSALGFASVIGVVQGEVKYRWMLVCLVPVLFGYWLSAANRDCKVEPLGVYAIQEVTDKDGSVQVIVVNGEIINITKWFGRNVIWKTVKVEKEEAETYGIMHDVRNMRLSNGDVEKEKPHDEPHQGS